MCVTILAVNQTKLQEVLKKSKINCHSPKDKDLKLINSSPLLKIVDCSDPFAIYSYDFKVSFLRASEPADLQFWGTLFFDPSFFGLNQ